MKERKIRGMGCWKGCDVERGIRGEELAGKSRGGDGGR